MVLFVRSDMQEWKVTVLFSISSIRSRIGDKKMYSMVKKMNPAYRGNSIFQSSPQYFAANSGINDPDNDPIAFMN